MTTLPYNLWPDTYDNTSESKSTALAGKWNVLYKRTRGIDLSQIRRSKKEISRAFVPVWGTISSKIKAWKVRQAPAHQSFPEAPILSMPLQYWNDTKNYR